MNPASPRQCRRRTPGEAGFTLMELLVAVALLGLLLALLFGGLRFGAAAWRAGDERVERMAGLQVAHRVMSGLVSRIFPLVVEGDDGLGFAFEGARDRLRFVAFMPSYPDTAGLYVIEFTVVKSAGGSTLRMSRRARWDNVNSAAGEPAAGEDVVVLETHHRLEFAYLEALADGNTAEWSGTWDQRDRLPALVRLGAAGRAAGGAAWPDLVIRPVIDLDPECILPETAENCALGPKGKAAKPGIDADEAERG